MTNRLTTIPDFKIPIGHLETDIHIPCVFHENIENDKPAFKMYYGMKDNDDTYSDPYNLPIRCIAESTVYRLMQDTFGDNVSESEVYKEMTVDGRFVTTDGGKDFILNIDGIEHSFNAKCVGSYFDWQHNFENLDIHNLTIKIDDYSLNKCDYFIFCYYSVDERTKLGKIIIRRIISKDTIIHEFNRHKYWDNRSLKERYRYELEVEEF